MYYKHKQPVPDKKPKRRGTFPDIQESTGIADNAIRGKTLAFIVDDREFYVENTVLPMAVFKKTGASGESKVVAYSTLFDSPERVSADIIVLRSSRLFASKFADLERSLAVVREKNPRSAIVLCVWDRDVFIKAQPLFEKGVVNTLVHDPPLGDFEILGKAAELFARLQ